MQLDLLYKSIAEALGLSMGEDGRLTMKLADLSTPCTVTHEDVTKTLAIPTKELLRTANWDHVVAMHPLCESATLKESPVLKKLRLLVNLRLNTITSAVMMELMTIAVNTDYHGKLSAAAAKYLTHIPDADEKMLTALSRVLQRVDVTGEYRLINVYLKHGGQWAGRDVFRLASVNFPLLDDELDDGSELFGVKMRKKDKLGIISLFRFVFPNVDDNGHYSYGSNSMVAPFFHALFKAFAKVASRLNAVVKIHSKHLVNKDELTTNLDWIDEFEDLSVFRDLIPTLNWNDGTYDKGTTPTPAGIPLMTGVPTHSPTQNVPTHTHMPVQQPAVAQHQQATQPVAQKGGAVSWDEVVRQRNQNQHQQSGYQAPVQQQWNQPPPPPTTSTQGLRGQPIPPAQQGWGQQQQWGRQPQQQWQQQQPQQQWGQQQQSQQQQWNQPNTYPAGI